MTTQPDTPIDNIILEQYPYPIAVRFADMLDTTRSYAARASAGARTFEFGVRAVVLGMIANYIRRDISTVPNAELVTRLNKLLNDIDVQAWVSIFDIIMQTYRSAREHFFLRHLYDLYWEAVTPSITERMGQLVQLKKLLSTELHNRQPDEAYREIFERFYVQVRELLEQFKFLADYNLIRIDRQRPDGSYDYTLFRGIHPQQINKALTPREPLTSGQLYLEHNCAEFLRLHPLLVDWPSTFDQNALAAIEEQDVGLFWFYKLDDIEREDERPSSVSYNLPGLLTLEETPNTVDAVFELLRLLRQHAQSKEDPRQAFTWPQLRQAAYNITDTRTKPAQLKHDPEVYLNRVEVQTAFRQFLEQHGHCFVIIGKSGVGKSSFVLAEIEAHLHDSEDVLLIILDGGGKIDDDDIFETLFHDFAETVHIPHPEGMTHSAAFVTTLANLPDIEHKQVIIVLDAINESPRAVQLLKSIDYWVSKAGQAGYKWLKFVITSRPQAWRTIQAGAGRLSEQYYFRPPGRTDMAFELEGFEIVEFDAKTELEQVYEKYAARYHVITKLSELPSRVRDVLRDPLALRFVMKTYGDENATVRDRVIPHTISHYQIIHKYVQVLRDARIVKAEDFDLLEDRLLPLMCARGYENFTTRAAIMGTNDSVLADIIFDDSVIFTLDGRERRVNQSFINLINAEILIREQDGTGKTDKIRFKYERFYDYFMADYLKQQTAQMDLEARKAFYVNLTGQLSKKAFLWGPLYLRLVDECREGNSALLQAMATVNDARVKDLVSSVLIEYGAQDEYPKDKPKPSEQVKALCLALLHAVPDGGELGGSDFTAAEIAIKTAEGLRLAEVIVTGILKPVDFIADAATEVLINLWCTPEDEAPDGLDVAVDITWQVLHKLHWTRLGQFRKGLRSLVIMLLTVLFIEYRNKARFSLILEHFRQLVPAIMRKVPLIGLFVRSKRKKPGSGRGLRQRILLLIANWIIYAAKQVGSRGRLMFDFASVTTFFNLSEADKEDYRQFIHHVNRTPEMKLEDLRPLLFKRIEDKQLIGAYIMTMGVMAYMPTSEREINQLIRELFEYGFEKLGRSKSPEQTTGTSMLGTQLITLRNTMIADSGRTPENVENFYYVLEQVEAYFFSHFRSNTSVISWMDIGSYYYFARRLGLRHDYELLRYALRHRLENGDIAGLARFHHDLAAVAWHVVFHSPELALDMLTIMHEELPAEIITRTHRESFIIDLIQVRMKDEYRTEIFLQSSNKLDEAMKQKTRTSKPQYNIGARVGVAGAWFGRDIMFDESPYMRKFLQYFLFTSLEARNEQHWMTMMFDVILSSLYQGQLVDIDALLKPYLER